jgi:hypothetical protein
MKYPNWHHGISIWIMIVTVNLLFAICTDSQQTTDKAHKEDSPSEILRCADIPVDSDNRTHKDLPSGPGLSAPYPGDDGIENHPDVVFFENFESGEIDDIAARWSEARNPEGKVISFSDEVPPGSAGRRSLVMTATRGENEGGHLYKAFEAGWDKIHLRFYTKFAGDHGYHHHFAALRGFINPLPYPIGGAGQLARDYFSVFIEPTGNEINTAPSVQHPPPGIWQFYNYWPEMRSWQSPDGVPDGRPNPYYGNSFQPGEAAVLSRGEWTAVELMVKLNTSPEMCDGELALWIDGNPVAYFAPGTPGGYWLQEHFRNDPDHPEAAPFEGFRWRNDMDVKINALWLLHFVSDGSFSSTEEFANSNPDYPVNTEKAMVWFDNVIMATGYIGTMKEIE